jgi:hypothetical protein
MSEVSDKVWRLWLDDQWNDPEMHFRHPPKGWTPAASYDEAVLLFNLHGWPISVSFDHDLGEAPAKTGYDFAKFLIEHDMDGGTMPRGFKFNVHSANPVGRDNIIGLMVGWLKEKSKREKDILDLKKQVLQNDASLHYQEEE